MFICTACVDKYEGPAVEYAKSTTRRSLGPCEVCRKVGSCFDIPSSASWWIKGRKEKTDV